MAIFHGNAIPSGATEEAYSLRFDRTSSAYNQRTFSAGGNQKIWTWSGWVKRGYMKATDAVGMDLWTAVGGSNLFELQFNSGNIQIFGKNVVLLLTNRIFDDPSAWYHITFRHDSTQASASNRLRLYVNGEEETSFATDNRGSYTQNFDGGVNTPSIIHRHGSNQVPGNFWDGYMSEVNFIDGQSLGPDSFGEIGDYGEWKPKQLNLTYGTTGFRLDYSDAAALGDDVSGNSNNFTLVNINSHDQVTDSPTNNFATFNPHQTSTASAGTLANGNLQLNGISANRFRPATQYVSSGKWYAEFYDVSVSGFIYGISFDSINMNTGGNNGTAAYLGAAGGLGTGYLFNSGGGNGQIFNPNNTAGFNNIASLQGGAAGDVVGIYLDMDYSSGGIEGAAYAYVNGTILTTGLTGNRINNYSLKAVSRYWTFNVGNNVNNTAIANFGQDGTFAGNLSAGGNTDANGIGNFKYAPPAGALALCTSNITDSAVVPSEYFSTLLYAGNNVNDRSLTGVGFQPELSWIKCRTSALHHHVYDSVRGAGQTKALSMNQSSAEGTESQQYGYLASFDSDGFTLGKGASGPHGNAHLNRSGDNYVSWNWKAGGATVSNTDGSITSTVSANVNAGFSIVSYTGTGSASTIGHGLSQELDMVLLKNRDDGTKSWPIITHATAFGNDYLEINRTNTPFGGSIYFNNTAPTSSVFSVGTVGSTNASGNDFIAYCFHNVDGYSKIGKFIGNGSTNGSFVNTGFRPSVVILKSTTNGSGNWTIFDDAVNPYNDGAASHLYPNLDVVEAVNARNLPFFSNGFKVNESSPSFNGSGHEMIYMAFAETPFKNTTAH